MQKRLIGVVAIAVFACCTRLRRVRTAMLMLLVCPLFVTPQLTHALAINENLPMQRASVHESADSVELRRLSAESEVHDLAADPTRIPIGGPFEAGEVDGDSDGDWEPSEPTRTSRDEDGGEDMQWRPEQPARTPGFDTQEWRPLVLATTPTSPDFGDSAVDDEEWCPSDSTIGGEGHATSHTRPCERTVTTCAGTRETRRAMKKSENEYCCC